MITLLDDLARLSIQAKPKQRFFMNKPILKWLPLLGAAMLFSVATAPVIRADLVAVGPWSGAVTFDSATVVARLGSVRTDSRLEVALSADFTGAWSFAPQPGVPGDDPAVVRFTAAGLRPDALHFHRIVAGGDTGTVGTFRTFPVSGAPASFHFAFSSCARTASNHAVWAEIQRRAPLLFLHFGDLHYEDITVDDRAAFRAAIARVLTAPAQAALYRAVPIAYVWDDHDFGPNNSDRTSPSRAASHAAYRELVPHYPIASPGRDGPIAQAFSIGRVRFIILDTRSQRDPVNQNDDDAKSMIGAWQKQWLKRELLSSADRHPLIFLVTSVGWTSADRRNDNWGNYQTERTELANFIKQHGLASRLCILTGDAHMLAVDDGRNGDYATGGGAPIRQLMAAPLDHRGSYKGGPYSGGAVLPAIGEGQFGLVTVEDTGAQLTVLFQGLNQSGAERLRFAFTVPAK